MQLIGSKHYLQLVIHEEHNSLSETSSGYPLGHARTQSFGFSIVIKLSLQSKHPEIELLPHT